MAAISGKLKKALKAMLVVAAFGPGAALNAGPTPSRPVGGEKAEKTSTQKPVARLGLAEYQQLKPILDVKNQPWTTIPWKYSITEARKRAAATRKPIFMVVNTGNALGCT